MKSDWVSCTIAECAADEPYSTQIGPFGEKIRAKNYTETGAPVLRGINVNSDGRFHDDDFVYIDPDLAEAEFGKFVCEADDVILCHKGTLGKIGIIPRASRFRKYIMGNSMMKVRCERRKLEPLYLYYWLTSREGQHYLFSRVSQVGVPQIQRPLTTLRDARLLVPPLPEQRAIAHILGTLDDKIELNRRMNQTLEEMARAIFKSWFVDFDPVRAKAEGRHPPGMDPATAALFPDSFEDSALGKIPKGWRVVPLSESSSYLRRGISPKYVDDGGMLVLNQKCIRGGTINSTLGRRHNNGRKSIDGSELQVWDVLVNSTGVGTLGRVAQVHELTETTIVDSHVTVVRAASNVATPHYLGTLLLRAETEIEALGEGSTGQTELSRARLGALDVIIPDLQVQRDFDQFVLPVRLRQAGNQRENECLVELRDTLLPRLLSGEISVTQAEQTIRNSA